jgi:hypothetical protein
MGMELSFNILLELFYNTYKTDKNQNMIFSPF